MSLSEYSHTNLVSTVDEIEEDEGAPAWMVTFADLVTLLLVFFILLFTIATVEAEKFKLVATSIQSALNEDDPVASKIVVSSVSSGGAETESAIACPENTQHEGAIGDTSKQGGETAAENKAKAVKLDDIQDLVKDIKGMIEQQRIGEYVFVYVDGDKVILRIKGTVLFGSGNEMLIKESRPIFAEINTLFNKYTDYKIDIKGYTDNVPIKTDRFPSNWELSAVRATTVLRYFVDKGINPARMSATGYADLFPVAENTTDDGRAKNRRVEFVLAKEK